MFLMTYQGGVDLFSVYGAHSLKEEGQRDESKNKFVVITDQWDEYKTIFNSSDNRYSLMEAPTAIKSVAVGKGCGSVILEESDNKNNLLWETTPTEVYYMNVDGFMQSVKVEKITGGNYFYDV
jgi:hypothetical protein